MTNTDKCLLNNFSCHVVQNKLYFSYLSANKFISQQTFLGICFVQEPKLDFLKFAFNFGT